jgi:hypothetical protein
LDLESRYILNQDLKQRILKLNPRKIKFNNREIVTHDLENRVINYIVSEDSDTSLLEDAYSTTWVINKDTADTPHDLKTILDKSNYVKWSSYPVSEYFSYKHVLTSSNSEEIPIIKSSTDKPLNFQKYTKWRLEYSKVLLGFYEAIQSQLDGFSIYMDGKPIVCLDKLNSKRIDINLQGLGNLNRHPYIYDHDLYQSKADLLIRIMTPDLLEYMHLKKKYQNYEFLTNTPRFEVLDKFDLPWTNHVWWEPFQDVTSLRSSKDDDDRLSYILELRCSIHFYEVEDELYHVIKRIKTVFPNLPEQPTFVYTLKN